MYLNLETERLFIRTIKLTDSKFIVDLVNSEGWLEFIGNRNIANEVYANSYIQKIIDNPNAYYHVYELKSTKELLGVITFLHRTEHEFPDIGFAMLPKYEKKGYTFEACRIYLEEVIKLNEYENIIAITVPSNQKSINLLVKLGFKYESDYKGDSGKLSLFSLRTGQKPV